MLTNWHAPLNAFARPFARDLEQPFGKAHARRRQSEASGVQRCKRDFQSCAFLRDDIFAGHPHLVKFHDRVIKRAESHEPATIRDFQPRRVHINNERGDLLALFSAHQFWRRAGHYDKHACLHAVRTPKFLAI